MFVDDFGMTPADEDSWSACRLMAVFVHAFADRPRNQLSDHVR